MWGLSVWDPWPLPTATRPEESQAGSSFGPSVQMSSGMSQLIGLKEKGLPQIARLLQSSNSDVVRSGASLLSNMSRHQALHRVMGECHTAPAHPALYTGLPADPHLPEAAGMSPPNPSLGSAFGRGSSEVQRGGSLGWTAGV